MIPRPSYAHIDMMTSISIGLSLMLNKKKIKFLKEPPLLKEGKIEIVPDVVIFKKKPEGGVGFKKLLPQVIIEIDDEAYVQRAIENPSAIMKKTVVQEAFIDDYQCNLV